MRKDLGRRVGERLPLVGGGHETDELEEEATSTLDLEPGPGESPVTSRATILLRGFVLMLRRFTILIKVSSSTNLVKSIVAREK